MSAPLLLIDVGNTRLKWTLAQDGRLEPARGIAHDGDPAEASAGIEADELAGIRISNVTGHERSERLARRLMARFRVPALIARTRPEHRGLRIAYADAARLGVDRWLMMLAARARAPGQAVAIGAAGTALTFDAVEADGRHLGGVIAPGLVTAQRATLAHTRFEAAGPEAQFDDGLGRDTEACVRQGAFHACAGLLDRLAARHPAAVLWLSGGDAPLLAPTLDARWQPVPDLVLEGLLAVE